MKRLLAAALVFVVAAPGLVFAQAIRSPTSREATDVVLCPDQPPCPDGEGVIFVGADGCFDCATISGAGLWENGTFGVFEDDKAVIVGADGAFDADGADGGVGDLLVVDDIEVAGSAVWLTGVDSTVGWATADAADNARMYFGAGGAGSTRGAWGMLGGNESIIEGDIFWTSGDAAGSQIIITNTNATDGYVRLQENKGGTSVDIIDGVTITGTPGDSLSLATGMNLVLTENTGANTIDIAAPTAMGANYTLTLPTTVAPQIGQVLGDTDAAGTLGWYPAVGGGPAGTGGFIHKEGNAVATANKQYISNPIDANLAAGGETEDELHYWSLMSAPCNDNTGGGLGDVGDDCDAEEATGLVMHIGPNNEGPETSNGSGIYMWGLDVPNGGIGGSPAGASAGGVTIIAGAPGDSTTNGHNQSQIRFITGDANSGVSMVVDAAVASGFAGFGVFSDFDDNNFQNPFSLLPKNVPDDGVTTFAHLAYLFVPTGGDCGSCEDSFPLHFSNGETFATFEGAMHGNSVGEMFWRQPADWVGDHIVEWQAVGAGTYAGVLSSDLTTVDNSLVRMDGVLSVIQESGVIVGDDTTLTFEGATADTFEGVLSPGDPTRDVTWTAPNETGTLALSKHTMADGRRWATQTAAGSTSLLDVKWAGSFLTATVTANADDADGSFVGYGTNAGASDSDANVYSSYAETRRDWDTEMAFDLKTGSDITVMRLWAGLFSGTPVASDTPTLHLSAFRYAPATDGTAFWRACTNDNASTPTCTTTTAAIAADTVYHGRIVEHASGVDFWLNGVLVAERTTDLPTATATKGPFIGVRSREAVLKTIKFGRFEVRHN